MLKRLEGAVMIINTFMPLIVILGMAALAWTFVHTVREAARGPLARIGASIDRMDHAITEAREAARAITDAVDERVAKPIESALEKVSHIPDSIQVEVPDLKIPDISLKKPKLEIPMPTIPGFKLSVTPIPGLFQLKQVFNDVFHSLARFIDVLKQISGIGKLGKEVTTVLAATGELVTAVKQAAAWIVTAVVVLFYLMVGWWLLSYAMWTHRRLRIGWALVRGMD